MLFIKRLNLHLLLFLLYYNSYHIIKKTRRPCTKLSYKIACFILNVILNSVVSFFLAFYTRSPYISYFLFIPTLCNLVQNGRWHEPMTDQKRYVQMVDDATLRPEDNMSNDTNAFFNSKKFQETYFFESYYYQLVTFDTSWCYDIMTWQSVTVTHNNGSRWNWPWRLG